MGGGWTRIRSLCALESYVFHITLEFLQELQIQMVMFESAGRLGYGCGSGGAPVSFALDLGFGEAAY